MEGLVFGWRSALFGMASIEMLVLAASLTAPLVNRTANRTLAALLVVLTGVITPWTIGFAGFYDKWPWLTFAPLSLSLAVAPLLWLYVVALVSGRWPGAGLLHLIPAGLQAAFLTVSFLLPYAMKDRWAGLVSTSYSAVEGLGVAIGLAIYGLAGLRLLRNYRERLVAERSDDLVFAARWLSRSIGAMLVLLPVWGIYGLWNVVAPLGYWKLIGLYLAIAVFGIYLGVEGWRHAELRFPHFAASPPVALPARDWRALGEQWLVETRTAGWARDPDLSLASLAARLGTNTSYLSRALNDGLGMNFSVFVNRLRCEAVAVALDSGEPDRDLLSIALDAGFSSKASFNRAFQATYGTSPSAYRRRHASHPK